MKAKHQTSNLQNYFERNAAKDLQPEDSEDELSVPLLGASQNSSFSETLDTSEPLTHVKNRTFKQKYFSCFAIGRRSHLNPEELHAFHSLKRECNILFDNQNDTHNKLVMNLWSTLTTEPLGPEISNPHWNDFGFQNIDPRTDFRGAGITSLKMFTSYAETYPEKVKAMCESIDDYLPAASSINVTHHLMKYFHLANFLVYEKDKRVICSRKALKNFCIFLTKDKSILEKFHHFLFTDLFEIWKDLKKKKANVTIMDFNTAMDELKRKLKLSMNYTAYEKFEDFTEEYSKIPNWSWKKL